MSHIYENKHLIDATDNQEVLPPEYQAALDQPIRMPDYEEWLDSLQSGNDETNGGGENERYSENTNRA